MSDPRDAKNLSKSINAKSVKGSVPANKSTKSSQNESNVGSAIKTTTRTRQQPSLGSVIDPANQVVSKQAEDDESVPDRTIASLTIPGASSQLRSTLAIGQLIASNRPTAGSRLIASELRHLSNSIQQESASIRAEIASLSTNLAGSLKSVMEEDREQRSIAAGNAFGRRPMFGHFAQRRFPVFRRRLATRMSVGTNTSSATSPTPAPTSNLGPSNLATKSSANPVSAPASSVKQVSAKSQAIARKAFSLFKNPWMPDERNGSYDSESDTDSTDTTPSSTP